MYHKSASSAKIKFSNEAGTEFTTLAMDKPASATYQPARHFDSAVGIKLFKSDIVTECVYNYDNDEPLEGGITDKELEYCFGVLTYYPPMPLAKCQSIPTEINLEVAYEFTLQNYNDDLERKRRRRKRQSDSLVLDFFDRRLDDGRKVRPVLFDWAESIDNGDKDSKVINDKVLAGKQLSICVSTDNGLVGTTKESVKAIPDFAVSVPSTEECDKSASGGTTGDGRTAQTGSSGDGSKSQGGGASTVSASVGVAAAILATVMILA